MVKCAKKPITSLSWPSMAFESQQKPDSLWATVAFGKTVVKGLSWGHACSSQKCKNQHMRITRYPSPHHTTPCQSSLWPRMRHLPQRCITHAWRVERKKKRMELDCVKHYLKIVGLSMWYHQFIYPMYFHHRARTALINHGFGYVDPSVIFNQVPDPSLRDTRYWPLKSRYGNVACRYPRWLGHHNTLDSCTWFFISLICVYYVCL